MSIATDPRVYWAVLVLTIFIILTKAIIAGVMGKRIYAKRKDSGVVSMDFLFGVFVLITCAMISRIMYLLFDFVLTKFDPSAYPANSGLWKAGYVVYAIGLLFLLFVIEKKILNWKFKGIFTLLILIGIIVIIIIPANTTPAFETASIVAPFGMLGSLIIPFLFIYIGVKTPGLRKNAFGFAFGVIIYMLGNVIVNEAIVSALVDNYGDIAQVYIYLGSTITKFLGLVMMANGALKFQL